MGRIFFMIYANVTQVDELLALPDWNYIYVLSKNANEKAVFEWLPNKLNYAVDNDKPMTMEKIHILFG